MTKQNLTGRVISPVVPADIAQATVAATGTVADSIRAAAAVRAETHDKGLRPIVNKCIVCGVSYDANMMTVDGEDTGKITPPRCPKHQTQYLTQCRVDKTCKDIRLLGNLKARLTDAQRAQIISVISDAVVAVNNHYVSAKVEKTGGFKLVE